MRSACAPPRSCRQVYQPLATDALHARVRRHDPAWHRPCVETVLPYTDLGSLRFKEDEIAWLRQACPYFGEPYLQFLAAFRLDPASQVQLHVTPEQDDMGALELTVRGLWRDVILYEVPIMAIISETYFRLIDTDWTDEGQLGACPYARLTQNLRNTRAF